MSQGCLHKKTACFTVLMFVFLLIVPAYSHQPEQEAEALVAEGERLLNRGEFEKALALFEKAAPRIQDSGTLAALYLKTAYIYYKLGDIPKSEEWLRNRFELDVDGEPDIGEWETGFSMVYKKIKAEYWFSVKSKTEEKKKEDRIIIQKFSPKPQKKKTKLFSILLIAGVVVTAIVMALFLWKNDTDVKRGLLLVYNYSVFDVTVIIGSLNRNVSSQESQTIYLGTGDYRAEITGQGNSRFYDITIAENETAIITFSGW